MIHAASVERSSRLTRVLNALRDGREHTSWELQMEARTVAVHTCISELRANGYAITCRRAGHVWTYRLEAHAGGPQVNTRRRRRRWRKWMDPGLKPARHPVRP